MTFSNDRIWIRALARTEFVYTQEVTLLEDWFGLNIGGDLNLNLNLTLALFEKHNDDLNQGQVDLIMMEGHWYWIRNRFPN